MVINEILRKKLEPLVNPVIEQALLLLLDHVLEEKSAIFDNPLATDAELRAFQGQKVLIKELKEYRKRLNDSILRQKEELDNVLLHSK